MSGAKSKYYKPRGVGEIFRGGERKGERAARETLVESGQMHGAASSIGCFRCCAIKISRVRHHHANVMLACSRQRAQLLSLL
jgi:hypothetical protein